MSYIKNREELRKVEFPKEIPLVIDCDGKGYFHRWIEKEKNIEALVEAKDGTMRLISAGHIQFVEHFTGENSVSL